MIPLSAPSPARRFVALLGLVLASGCTHSPAVPDAGGSPAQCIEDADCPNPKLFYCDSTTSLCVPSCREKADCGAEVRKEHALAYCALGLGCECDLGRCVSALCSSDLDCGATQACRDGACVAPPEAAAVAGCAVFPDYLVLKQGARAKFSVLAWDARAPVVVKTGITWTAVSPAVTSSAASTGSSAEFIGGTPNAAAEQAVKATVGSSQCFARVLVLPDAAPATDSIDVLVTDELTGRPIPSASVLVSAPLTGAPIVPAADTGPTGFVNVPGLAGNPIVTVTVFHADYNYLTVANYDLAGSRFLSLVLRRNPLDKFGGYKGTVKDAPLTSNFHLGLAGTSQPGLITDLALTDLSFTSMVGRNVPTRFKIGTAIDFGEVPLPTGLYVGFNDRAIKSNVSALGLAGVCLNATGAADEAAISAGTCGTRSAWAFTGDVPLGDLPAEQFGGGFYNVNFLKFFQRIRPMFWKFHSSIVRDVQFTLKTTPKNPDRTYRFSDADGGLADFSTVDHNFFKTGAATAGPLPMAFDLVVKLPDLPKFRDAYPDTAMLFGGAIVPGRGFVPLGLGVADNTTPIDAKTDAQSGPYAPGLVTLRTAPPHHGLEGSAYGIVALALRTTADVRVGLATSAIFSRLKDGALKFDPKGVNPIDLGPGFPAFPDGAKYNYLDLDTLGPDLAHRTFKFLSPPPVDPLGSVTRVVFTDEADHAWVVYLDPAQATRGFSLPKPAGGFSDRTFFTGMTTGARSPFFVQQLRLNDNPAAATGAWISFNKLVELNSTNGDRLADFATGFSLVDYQRPSITWMIPRDPRATVPKGSAVLVAVRGFNVGSTAQHDGYVRLQFTPQNAGCPDAFGRTDESNGKGEIVLTIPASCVLANAELTASLMTSSGAELMPPVSSVQIANIQ